MTDQTAPERPITRPLEVMSHLLSPERLADGGGGDGPLPERLRVLLIEDNPGDALLFSAHLSGTSQDGTAVEISHVSRLEDGIRHLQTNETHVVVLDLGLPDCSGLESLQRLVSAQPDAAIAVQTGNSDFAMAIRALQAGAHEYLVKGHADGPLLMLTICNAYTRKRMRAQIRAQITEIEANEIRLGTIMESSPNGLIVVDAELRVRYANASARQFFADHHPLVTDAPAAVLAGPEGDIRSEINLGSATFEVQTAPIAWNKLPCQLLTVTDVSEKRIASERLTRDRDIQTAIAELHAVMMLDGDLTERLRAMLAKVSALPWLSPTGTGAVILLDDLTDEGRFVAEVGSPRSATRQFPQGSLPCTPAHRDAPGAILAQQACEACPLADYANMLGEHVCAPIQLGTDVLGRLIIATQSPAQQLAEVPLIVDAAARLMAIAIIRDRTHGQLDRLSRAVDQCPISILITDAQSKILYANAYLSELTGYAPAEIIGQRPSIFKSNATPADVYRDLWHDISNGITWTGELCNLKKNGERYWERVSISPVVNDDGDTTHFIAVKQDITQERQYRADLERLATHDVLTGLPNRAMLVDRLTQALGFSKRLDQKTALLYIDLDAFKLTNETQGHLAGDEVLVAVSQRLRNAIREHDTVARIGADEFAVILTGINDKNDLPPLVDKIANVVTMPMTVCDNPISVTASIGIAVSPDHGQTAQDIQRHAEIALHNAKAAGMKQLRYFEESMECGLTQRVALRRALEDLRVFEQLSLHYQPKIDLVTGRLIGAEALLRWSHPELGRVSPADFIPIAEEIGLIIQIGAWVIDQTCSDLAKWHAEGRPLVPVAINVSGHQLRHSDVAEKVQQALRKHDLPNALLEIELTESVLLHDTERALQQFGRFAEMGIPLAMDDFGTGFSSLSYLRRFSFERIKIDRSFVSDIATQDDAQALCRTIIAMGRGLDHRVLAEGVETHAQLSLLRRMGCHEAQGYLFSPPVPAEEFKLALTRDNWIAPDPESRQPQRNLLIVDDEEYVLQSLRRLLRKEGYTLHFANSGEQALEILANVPIGVIVSDQRMPTMTGTEFFRRVKNMYPGPVRIVLSGYTDIETVLAAINDGAIYKFIPKPWDDVGLRGEILRAFEIHEEREQQKREDQP